MVSGVKFNDEHMFFGDDCVETIPFGYVPIEPVGQGAYGFVFSALKLVKNGTCPTPVAVKKLCEPGDSQTSEIRLFRELLCMREMDHPNVLKLMDVVYFNQNIYIVSELMETDLGSVVKSKQNLSADQMITIFYQLIDGIKYIHDCGVIHRDLKPRNILLSANCDVKICDFGLARLAGRVDTPFTEYVCTRWYRAPEILFPSCSYTNKIDIFSLGCIIGEVVSMKPLLPGRDSTRQFDLIVRRFGMLSEQEIATIPDALVRKYIHKLNASARIDGDLEEYIGVVPPPLNEVVNKLIRSLVRFNPRDRSTADALLDWEVFRDFDPIPGCPAYHRRLFYEPIIQPSTLK